MTYVVARPGESFEAMLRRFKKSVERSGVLAELKKREFYEKPSVRKKKKSEAAKKRKMKEEKKASRFKLRFKPNSNKNFQWNEDRTKKLPLPPPRKRPTRNTVFNKPRSSVRSVKR